MIPRKQRLTDTINGLLSSLEKCESRLKKAKGNDLLVLNIRKELLKWNIRKTTDKLYKEFKEKV